MELTITQAHPSDAKSLELLYKQFVNNPNICVTPEQLELLTHDKFNYLFTARFHENIVATAFLTICRDVMFGDQPFAILENIVVDSLYQKKGIGTKLMAFIQSYCKDLKCTKIMLLSSSNRENAHKFFRQCGYSDAHKHGFVNYINR
ncbi:MAG: hypothetical protein A2577_06430 [Bdellovibrionales bacterium RIFOXYD1_FULL_36_51]|nr:MAG: hypothetical protein A2417_13120 [Bdellovibrionales bacterium RIFOXYC1_FULL_37_79]OFZ63516.1 MAG: hypothetical protein A2577_06430 [Bdellovibrionales bacterium RIFOXYD1_FULL_36_51]